MTITNSPNTAMNHTLKTFTDLTHKMRLAQNRYFELAAKVRKTNHPDDHKARKDALALSKGLENQVDAAIQDIIMHVSDIHVGDIDQQTGNKLDGSYFRTENF